MKTSSGMLLLCALAALLFFQAEPAGAEKTFSSSLWVPCETAGRNLDTPESVDAIIRFASQQKIDTLFIQVYRGNRTWYSCEAADDSPAKKYEKAFGHDMLTELLSKAHEKGISVHAWFNMLRLAMNREAPILKLLGKDIVTCDSKGRNLLDYPKFQMPDPESQYYEAGDPGIWLDAGHPGVQKYLDELIRDFLEKYPGIDGVHLDFIRLPSILPFSPGPRFKGLSMGYGHESLRRFREDFGFDPLTGKLTSEQSLQWENFRRNQITQIVKNARAACRDSQKELSAAVRPWISRAYQSDGQDWPRWLQEGLLDFAILMNYTTDLQFFKYMTLTGLAMKQLAPEKAAVHIGIGAYLLDGSPGVLKDQIRFLKDCRADGVCIFSYDSMKDPEAVYKEINGD